MKATSPLLQRTLASIFLLATALFSAQATTAAEPEKHPNLVFVFADQMRGQAMGFLGQEPVITPNLDRFADEALVLTEAVSNYPVCSPYRGMLMTGKFSHANKVLSNCTSKTAVLGIELQESDRCWSDVLSDKGYSLGYIGKWHLDGPREPFVKSYNNRPEFAWNEWCPPNRRHGFDFWYAYGTFDQHMTPEYWSTDMTRDQRVKVQQWGPEHEADLAIKYIENEQDKYRRGDRPFALVVSMNPPHTPYGQVPQKYVDQYVDKTAEELITRKNVNLKENTSGAKMARRQIKNYLAMITGIDDQFGRIARALGTAGIERETIVIFTADHGNCLGSHDVPTKNVHYDESMIVPFMIRWPGKIAARRDNLLISTPDIYPTMLDLLGFNEDIPETVQGVSHAGLFTTGQGPRPTSAKYMWVPADKPAWGRRGVRTNRYTLMIDKRQDKPARYVLHDNVEDPFQLKNLAGERPEVVERLVREELIPWLRRSTDPWAVPHETDAPAGR